MRNVLAVAAAFLAFLLLMFIAWYAGVDFNERGVIQAVALSVSVWVAFEVYDNW